MAPVTNTDFPVQKPELVSGEGMIFAPIRVTLVRSDTGIRHRFCVGLNRTALTHLDATHRVVQLEVSSMGSMGSMGSMEVMGSDMK